MTPPSILELSVAAASDEGSSGSSNDDRTPRSASIIAGRRSGRRTQPGTDSEEVKGRARSKTPNSRQRTPAKESDQLNSEETEAKTKSRPRVRKRAVKASTEDVDSNDSVDTDGGAEEPVAKPRRRRTRRKENTADVNVETTDSTSDATTTSNSESSGSIQVEKGQFTDTGHIEALNARINEQNNVLNELRAGLLALGQQLDRTAQKPRLGVFVDVPNLMYGQEPDEKPINMGKLLDLLRGRRDIVRATAYSPISDNPAEPLEGQKFVAPFVPYEYRIVTKPLKRFADGSIKGNFDVEMAIDMLTMADRLDVIAIVSGDADFARAVEVVQTRGVRVEVVAFAGSSSLEMRSLADQYIELGAVIDQVI